MPRRPDTLSLRAQEYFLLRLALVQARIDAGLTQKALAKQLGRATSYVSKYETGERKLRIGYFVKICDVLDLDARREIMRVLRPEAFE